MAFHRFPDLDNCTATVAIDVIDRHDSNTFKRQAEFREVLLLDAPPLLTPFNISFNVTPCPTCHLECLDDRTFSSGSMGRFGTRYYPSSDLT